MTNGLVDDPFGVFDDYDWRSVIDAIRPFSHRIWRELPPGSKRSFLEHARAWWDVHRHRMAPEVEARVAQAALRVAEAHGPVQRICRDESLELFDAVVWYRGPLKGGRPASSW